MSWRYRVFRSDLEGEVSYSIQPQPTDEVVQAGLQNSIRNTLAYLIKIDRATYGGNQPSIPEFTPLSPDSGWREFVAEEIFTLERGHFHSISDLDPGDYVTISRISTDNGFVGLYDMPDEAREWTSGTITVSTVTGDAFAQPVPFIATDNVVMCSPKPEFNGFSPASLMFAAQMLSSAKWRYSYGRQCYQRRFAKTQFAMPVDQDGGLNYRYMEKMVEAIPYWQSVKDAFSR